jgi:rhodanese-related sulfurtransferase
MKPLFIDVREPNEFKRGHVRGALNVPPSILMSGLPSELAQLPRDTPLILYCVSGARSRASIAVLSDAGFTNLTNGINRQQVEQKYFR